MCITVTQWNASPSSATWHSGIFVNEWLDSLVAASLRTLHAGLSLMKSAALSFIFDYGWETANFQFLIITRLFFWSQTFDYNVLRKTCWMLRIHPCVWKIFQYHLNLAEDNALLPKNFCFPQKRRIAMRPQGLEHIATRYDGCSSYEAQWQQALLPAGNLKAEAWSRLLSLELMTTVRLVIWKLQTWYNRTHVRPILRVTLTFHPINLKIGYICQLRFYIK